MQCASLLKKRSPDVEPWSYRAKRMCLEVELLAADCPMESSNPFSVSNQQQEQKVGAALPRPLLRCPRCLGGEPGHINHIVGH
ncbi:uncharacterized protein si:ch211-221j21.3 [Brachionichthys hirsutus]|uniref:uncharacterized protein si:ch211-221j21.3 n=1 Tax=Brachionichthys hirsutus TaxID=412623 RepID=UPI003604F41F